MRYLTSRTSSRIGTVSVPTSPSTPELGEQRSTAVAEYLYDTRMILGPREHGILDILDVFKLADRTQLQTLIFDGLSRKPCDRSLARLQKLNLITQLNLRRPGKLGGATIIYKLAGPGLRMYKPGANYRDRVANPDHTLAILDIYITLVRLEREGILEITDYASEPRPVIEDSDVRPDLEVRIQRGKTKQRAWFEADLGSERTPQLRRKLEAIISACEASAKAGRTGFPKTIWVCPDEKRRKLLKAVIEDMRDAEFSDGSIAATELFGVATFDSLAKQLS